MTPDRAARVLLWLVPLRLAADLAWAVRLPGGWSGSQLAGGALALVALVAAAPTLGRIPGRPVAAAAGILLAVGAARASSWPAAAANALHLAAPFGVWALGFTAGRPAIEDTWRRAAWAPLLASAAAAPFVGPVVLDGWPRIVGAYGNLHGAATASAVVAASAWLAAPRAPRGPTVALALLATALLAGTLVRGPVVFLLAALVLGGTSRWHRAAAAALALASGGLVASRGSDLGAIVTGTPPPGGWGALGSHRLRIWGEATATFLSGPPLDVVVGRGLGGQLGLHRHLDPHQELLSLWFQLGVAGPLTWIAAGLLAARAAGPGPARGLVLATGLLSLLGNDVLYRPSLLWWVAGAAGLAAGARAVGGTPSPDGAR